MAKQGRWDDHSRVITALVHFQVGSASQGDLHLYQNFPLAHAGNRNPLNFHVLFAVEDRCRHLSVHSLFPSYFTACPLESRSSSNPVADWPPVARLPRYSTTGSGD